MIFDINMDNFRRKAILVAGGHVTKPPATTTYVSVVLTETVRIALAFAALNYLQVRTADIKNAYTQATVATNIWTVLGPEFGMDDGKPAVVARPCMASKALELFFGIIWMIA